jgi:hypothetical protein
LQGEDKLDEEDMIAVLWVGIFTLYHCILLNIELKFMNEVACFWGGTLTILFGGLCMQEMIFRGTDTTALLTEWTMAELVLNPEAQKKAQAELDAVVGRDRSVKDSDIPKLPYLQAVVKEALRMHPPGPLLSWARLSTEDVNIADGMCVPAGTTAMVNMWSITHDPTFGNRLMSSVRRGLWCRRAGKTWM